MIVYVFYGVCGIRVQVFLSLRAENEARCDDYVKEIKVRIYPLLPPFLNFNYSLLNFLENQLNA